MQEHQNANPALDRLQRLEAFLATDPDNRALLADVIDQALAAGATARAEQHVQAGLSRFPDDPSLQGRQGHVLLAQQRWSDAADYFEVLLQRFPDIHLAYNLAYASQRCARHTQAVAALQPYADQLEAPAAAALLRSLHHLGELAAARTVIAQQEQSGRVDADFYAAASAVCFDANALEDAERLCQAAAAGDAPPIEALVIGGSVALARTDTGAARALLQQAIERNPREGRAWASLGLASLLDHDLAQATAQLTQAAALLPGHLGTLNVLGWCKVFARDLTSAEAVFREALEVDRNLADSHGGLAVVQALQGLRAEAEASIERALGLDEASLSARYAQMVLSGVTSDPEKFQALAQRLLSRHPAPFGGTLADLVGRSRSH